MEESVTYQANLEKGALLGEARCRREEALRFIRRLGQRQLGPLDAAAENALAAITDPDHLERIADRLLEVSGWTDLLATL
jgi:hypothetical protein